MTENNIPLDEYLGQEMLAQIQEFYGLAPEKVRPFLEEMLTLHQVEKDLREALKYSSLAEAVRPNKKGEIRLKSQAFGKEGKRVTMYLVKRRWIWVAIQAGRLQPRWKD